MNDRGWEELIDLIDQKFAINSHKKREEAIEDHPELKKQIEQIDFEKTGEQIRIERVTSPAIVDKKTFYHKSGVQNRTQIIYDPDDLTSKVYFYKLGSNREWDEIKPEALFN